MINDNLPRQIIGGALAALACVIAFFILPLSVFSPRLMSVVPIFLAFAGVYSGWFWAIVGALGAAVCAYFGADAVLAGAAFIALVLPVGVCYYTYRKRLPFERAIFINIGAIAACGFCGLMLVRLIKGDLADISIAYIKELWDSQVSFDIFGGGFQRSIQSRDALLSLFASQGYLSSDLINELQTNPTSELYTRCINYVIYNMRYVINYTTTGNLMSAALFAGVTITAWPRMAAVRQAVEPEVPFLPLRNWFMRADTALFFSCSYIATMILTLFMPSWWYSVDYAIKQCAFVAMCIQGVAAMERHFRQSGTRRGTRGALIFALTLFFRSFVAAIGVISALFGSHGAISSWYKKKMEDNGEDE